MAKVNNASGDAARSQPVVVKVADLVARARAEKPQIFGKLNDKKVEGLVRLVIQQLGKSVEATEEGSVRVPSFGTFNVKMVDKAGAGGEKVATRRVTFRPMKAKEPETNAES